LLALVISTSVNAQETDDPPVFAISYFQCDWGDAFSWLNEMDSLSTPIWQELVNEGAVNGYGVIQHDFAGYENVIIWRSGASLAAIEEAQMEAGRRLNERHPDAPVTSCTMHRDGIYHHGPGTGTSPEGYENMLISYYQCDGNLRDDIAESADSLMRPIAQELVDEGLMGAWGMLVHDWAGRENIIVYRSAKDRAGLFESGDEMNRRMSERHPDADVWHGCNQHRDGLYYHRTRTMPAPETPSDG
jgi:hypothetical protein